MDLMYCLTADAHTLEDSEITALLKFFVRECDRRFIDYQDIIEEVEQEMDAEINAAYEEEVPDYACTDQQGWQNTPIIMKGNYIMERCTVWGNGDPCVYVAIESAYYYGHSSKPPIVKVGLSRSMGKRRRAIRYYYGVETIEEVIVKDERLEDIEQALIQMLHSLPTSEWVSDEVARLDGAIAELFISTFRKYAEALAQ